MSLTAIIEALVAAGATPEMILAAVRAAEAPRLERQAVQREKTRQRVQRHRKKKRDVTDVTQRNALPASSLNGFPPHPLSLNPSSSVTPAPPPTGGVLTPTDFDEAWNAFPKQRKGSRAKAESAYRAALARGSPDQILSGIRAYAGSDEVARGFAKGMAAWLNDDRWNNDYSTIPMETTNGTKAYRNAPSKFEIGLAGIAASRAKREQREQAEAGRDAGGVFDPSKNVWTRP